MENSDEELLANGLSVRQQKFVQQLLITGDKTVAHERAGYFAGSKEGRGVMAHRLSKEPAVARAIFKAKLKRQEKCEIDAARVLEEWLYLAFSDPDDFMDFGNDQPNPPQRPANEIPEHARRAISSIKVKTHSWTVDDVEHKETNTEYRLWDKNAALRELGKHLGLTPEKVDVTSTNVNVNVDIMALLQDMSQAGRLELLAVLRKRREARQPAMVAKLEAVDN